MKRTIRLGVIMARFWGVMGRAARSAPAREDVQDGLARVVAILLVANVFARRYFHGHLRGGTDQCALSQSLSVPVECCAAKHPRPSGARLPQDLVGKNDASQCPKPAAFLVVNIMIKEDYLSRPQRNSRPSR